MSLEERNSDLEALARDILHLRYTIMRNWETMPPLGDIDFFVHPEDKAELEKICSGYLAKQFYDIRTIGDNYYPPLIEKQLLFERERWGLWWVLNKGAHLTTLMYHQLVHKGDHRYQDKLDKIFLDECGIVEPNDKGVGYHDPRTN